jgi:type I restriction system adenine methylase HsdM
MENINTDQQRDELHRAIWAIADELRGSVDGWDFKSYVLGMMFYRYISENLTNYINEGEEEAGNTGFDYALLSDGDAEQAREDLVQTKGFFILPSELFCNVTKKASSDENLNMTLEAVFRHIEESAKGSDSEDDFAGLFDDIDVNSNKLGATVAKRNANLVKLMDGIANMNLGNYKDHSIDAFGDAYEYLMSMYASNAGKSGGEFFTPQEVSQLLARLAVVGKTEVNKVYDPACGSGSLLLQASKILGKDKVRQGFYGQEIKPKEADKDSILDDVVFEMELVKQVEVNIDYILMLVAKYHDENCKDKEILVAIDKAIRSSLQLRSKKELIEDFIETINTSSDVNGDWQKFVQEQKEVDIQELIQEEKLKPEETKKLMENAFRDGVLKTTGTDVDKILPPVSRFGGGGSRDKKKQTVINKLRSFFEKYFGLINQD